MTATATVAPSFAPAGTCGAGVMTLEVSHGAFLSAARPVLVVDSPEVGEGWSRGSGHPEVGEGWSRVYGHPEVGEGWSRVYGHPEVTQR